MPWWEPSPSWAGEDAYVLGGGDSLRANWKDGGRPFDWALIRGRNVVGCNSAFILGAHVCPLVIFGDHGWWSKIGRKGTESYGGVVVSVAPVSPKCPLDDVPWLLTMRRKERLGWGAGVDLAWIGNTGAAAINLALTLGARRVFLLGFDMSLGPTGRMNYHDLRWQPGKQQDLDRFKREFGRLAPLLARDYPDREVVNVSDVSELECFPRQSLSEHFRREDR